jgi:hypothetical protein
MAADGCCCCDGPVTHSVLTDRLAGCRVPACAAGDISVVHKSEVGFEARQVALRSSASTGALMIRFTSFSPKQLVTVAVGAPITTEESWNDLC